jgi:hypothetical protein
LYISFITNYSVGRIPIVWATSMQHAVTKSRFLSRCNDKKNYGEIFLVYVWRSASHTPPPHWFQPPNMCINVLRFNNLVIRTRLWFQNLLLRQDHKKMIYIKSLCPLRMFIKGCKKCSWSKFIFSKFNMYQKTLKERLMK